MGALKWARESDHGDYVAKPQENLRYRIDRFQNVAGYTEWEVNVGRDYLATPSPHFGRDMRTSKWYRYLREAKAACQEHYDQEGAR